MSRWRERWRSAGREDARRARGTRGAGDDPERLLHVDVRSTAVAYLLQDSSPRRTHVKPIAVVVFMLALGVGTAEGQVLKCVDTAGVTHYVGAEADIREQYRAGAKEPRLPEVWRMGDRSPR